MGIVFHFGLGNMSDDTFDYINLPLWQDHLSYKTKNQNPIHVVSL